MPARVTVSGGSDALNLGRRNRCWRPLGSASRTYGAALAVVAAADFGTSLSLSPPSRISLQIRHHRIYAPYASQHPAIEAVDGTLSTEHVRTVIGSRDRFVPTTVNGRLSGLIDREAVALAVARAAVASA
jgi:hypothetical protein